MVNGASCHNVLYWTADWKLLNIDYHVHEVQYVLFYLDNLLLYIFLYLIASWFLVLLNVLLCFCFCFLSALVTFFSMSLNACKIGGYHFCKQWTRDWRVDCQSNGKSWERWSYHCFCEYLWNLKHNYASNWSSYLKLLASLLAAGWKYIGQWDGSGGGNETRQGLYITLLHYRCEDPKMCECS